ncbi:MAG TPA: zinc ABC transporter substrate-binding protein [Trebonia sp.]|jgi:zinc/manganese transport system substrate-binding protein|nr:zinc ABC transporter substrate-binding protein [Trebonia sp.]
MLLAIAAALVATAVLAFGDGTGSGAAASPAVPAARGTAGQPGTSGQETTAQNTPVIQAIGAENQYANVIAQVGGQYVRAGALMSNPNTDPHTFEASPAVARQVGQARLVVQNGLGYDSFMNSIESATPSANRVVIDVQQLLRLPDSTPNPHLWYDPGTMPAVARAIAADLSRIEPAHAAYFADNADKFVGSLGAWNGALASFAKSHKNVKIACTEPVADYLLQAAGADNVTPWSFQADIMNGVDPSPQDVATERALLADREVSVFVYNEQVTDPLTDSLIALADSRHIPVVGVYETMPEPGYDYQSWMLAETSALRRAVVNHTSAEHL